MVNSQLRGAALLADIAKHEDSPLAIARAMGPGCRYNKTTESESRIGSNGQAQIHTRTCREVTGCTDTSQNVPKDCEPWSDWHDA